MARQVSGWFGFAALAVAVLGMVGVAATYAMPVPYERLMARERALDEALVAAAGPDAAGRIAALAPRLDDSADGVGAPDAVAPAAFAARVAAARAKVRAELGAEAATINYRMRAMILVTMVMAIAFVGAMLRAAAGPPAP